jgi:hypothetical protein
MCRANPSVRPPDVLEPRGEHLHALAAGIGAGYHLGVVLASDLKTNRIQRNGGQMPAEGEDRDPPSLLVYRQTSEVAPKALALRV